MKSEDFLYIEAYDLAKFLVQVQEAVLKGFRLKINDIPTYPSFIAGRYWVTMVKESAEPVKTEAPKEPETTEAGEAPEVKKTVRAKAK